MIAIIVVAATVLVALGIGRTLVDRALTSSGMCGLSVRAREKAVFACAAGLGIVAYGVFALGMLGLLSAPWLGTLLAVLGLIGMPGLLATLTDARQAQARDRDRTQPTGVKSGADRAIAFGAYIVLGASLFVALAACYQPPGAHAWDALAYHLADPKIFLFSHKIVPLPTEHHSNFPFTMEMLFTIGLAFEGYAAANIFHLLTAVLLVLAILSFCDRFFSARSGLLAAVIFVTTPLVLWEATIAYIDLGLALFVFLAAYMILLRIHAGTIELEPGIRERRGLGTRILILAGVFMGFGLGIKYLALVPMVLFVGLALWRRIPRREVVLFFVAACAVGCPWYIKNTVWMHNPVYPFAYNVFGDSRYWSADRAVPYAAEQRSFGLPHDPGRPIEALRNLVVVPWRLVTNPEVFTNRADFTFTSLIGGLYFGLILSLVGIRSKPGVVRDLLSIVTAMAIVWFFVSQHIRYLIPVLPFGAVLCGYCADCWIAGMATGSRQHHRMEFVNRIGAVVTASALIGHVILVAWGISVLPVAGSAAVKASEAGLEPTALSVSELLTEIARPGERVRHLRRLNSYGAAQWINEHAPAGAGVVLYEDVHGFYIDRPYLWGNGEHSSYIPYGNMRTGRDLTEWLENHGIKYALINLNFAPSNPHVQVPDDTEAIDVILRNWYPSAAGWRGVLGDAIQSGQWVVRYAHHGVAVLEIGGARP